MSDIKNISEIIKNSLLEFHEQELAYEKGAKENSSALLSNNYFSYINVIEKLLVDNIEFLIGEMDCCKCERCRADLVALTLSSLQPKYVVIDKKIEDKLIKNYYDMYLDEILFKLKLCSDKIKQNPNH